MRAQLLCLKLPSTSGYLRHEAVSPRTYQVLLARRSRVCASAATQVERAGPVAWRFGSDAADQRTCHYGAVSTVQVITAPVDWPAIVAASLTGVTALVGFAVTNRQADKARETASRDLERNLKEQANQLKNSIAAEDRRAIQAQKMRIYSVFQGAVDDIMAVAERNEQQEGEFSKAYAAMVKAAAEVVLVAPEEIGVLTQRIKRSLSDNIGPGGVRNIDLDPQGKIKRNCDDLFREMKADLATYQTQPAHAARQ